MKNFNDSIIALATIFAFSFTGCEKDPFKPGEDNDEHPIIWQYKYDQHQIYSDVMPAMDENGNIFFSIQNGDAKAHDVYVFANDKDGNALWDKHYNNTSGAIISRVMYIDNKVIYTVLNYDPLSYYQETIYCLNALNGNIIWEYSPDFINEDLIEAIAVTSNYVVVGAKWGGEYPDIYELHYFDLTSGALIKSVDLGDDVVKLLSIVGNSAYLGTLFRVSSGLYAPRLIKMDLASDNILWTYNPTYEADDPYIFENRSIAVDENGRVFCVIRKGYSLEPSNIYIINDDGTLSTTIPISEHNHYTYNILIDEDNNFYTNAIEGFAKFSPGGGKIWDFYTGTTVPNASFWTGCLLGDDGYVYHAEDGGILNVNTEGEIAWAKYNETQFTKPGYPLLNDDGDMIVVGDLFVSCIKGDGAKIQDAPWPRIYQNNGNTSSR